MFKPIWLPITVLTLLTIFSGCQKEPTASFTVSSTSIEVGESVSFTNTSADADSYEWDFGDGNTSSTVSPTHTYNTAGTYTVSLTAISKNEKKKDKATGVITVKIQVQTGTLTDDRDGQTYTTVKIGNQWWMAENLNYYTSSGSWYYDNDSSTYADTYGRLYDWETACNSCPTGWHLPTDEEWKTLEMYLGMSQVEADAGGLRGTDEGGKLKETGTTHWYSPNTGATNESGFTALPGGFRLSDGSFYYLGKYAKYAYFWTATEIDASYAWYRILGFNYTEILRNYYTKPYGRSVRCVKD